MKDTVKRRYDRDFKEEAVRLLLRSSRKIVDVSKDLGIERSALGRWKKAYLEENRGGLKESKNSPPSVAEMEQEIGKLKNKIADVTEQRDILKKALGIFSQKKKNSFSL